VRFIYGKGDKYNYCYMEQTTSDECTEGFEDDQYDFYSCGQVAEAGCSLVKANAECRSSDSRMPDADSLQQCAESVQQNGGVRFLYGKGGKRGRCYTERTSSDECTEGFEDDQYDFYTCAEPEPCSLVKADAECRSSDSRMRDADSWQQCAHFVQQSRGVRFIYGKGGKSGRCYTERTSSDECTEGFEDDQYDFYSCAQPATRTTTRNTRRTTVPCVKTRVSIYTVTTCGEKTDISYTMKGFDIAKMTPKKLKVLDVMKAAIATQIGGKLGLRGDQITVTFKAGSIIAIIAVPSDAMPMDPPLGDGQDMMQLVQDIPDSTDLVEEGKTMADCYVDPEPAFPVEDTADAVGDPHLTTVYGEKLDLQKLDLQKGDLNSDSSLQ